jgi:hypothetical protein
MIMHAQTKYQKLMETQAPQPLTEAELAVELPENVSDMTVAELERWIKARAQA